MCDAHDDPHDAVEDCEDRLRAARRRFAGVDRRRFLGAIALGGMALAGGLARRNGRVADAAASIASLEGPAEALEPAERLSLRVPPGMLMFPVDAQSDCYILDNFGDDRGTRLHEGVDIMGSRGAAVFAVASGVLVKRYTNTGTAGYGWTLYDPVADIQYKYFHLGEPDLGLREDDEVSLGQVIGEVGKSGTFGVDNYHLHFERRVRSGSSYAATDALPYLHVPGVCGISPPYRA